MHKIGTGAHFVLQQRDNDPSDEIDEFIHFIENSDDAYNDEFDTWVYELMDILDSGHETVYGMIDIQSVRAQSGSDQT